MNSLLRSIAAAAVLLASAAGVASAQDWRLSPTYGTVTLNTGFLPDPVSRNLQSGGNINAQQAIGSDSQGRPCLGYIARRPDYRLHYRAGNTFPLIISVESQADTTLVVNNPNTSWSCNDDANGTLNPALRYDHPSSGQYDIWVGTYGSPSLRPATLFISELHPYSNANAGGGYNPNPGPLPPPPPPQTSGGPDWRLPPTYGTRTLNTGFLPDPVRVNLQSGGNINAAQAIGTDSRGRTCLGWIAQRPDYRLHYRAGNTYPLILSVASNTDTTLVVNNPNTTWTCDDDGGNGLNPSIRYDHPSSGQYDIWVGTYGSPSIRPATLSISELYSE